MNDPKVARMCANCGQSITLKLTTVDTRPEWFWVSPDDMVGCVWDAKATHPCGGTYELSDYHQPACDDENCNPFLHGEKS
jgi:hypothetical protein